MDLPLALERNRLALVRIVAMLFAASGMVAGQPARLSPIIRGTVLFFLRPAESAARRLIFVHAKRLVVTLRARRAAPTAPIPRGKGERVRAFPLFDPRHRVGTGEARRKYVKGDGPRIFMFGDTDPTIEPSAETPPSAPDDLVDATQLCRRLQALKAALESIPKQARRMARAEARRKMAPPGPRRVPPLRFGRPPGFRARGSAEIDDILAECHRLALMAQEPADTS